MLGHCARRVEGLRVGGQQLDLFGVTVEPQAVVHGVGHDRSWQLAQVARGGTRQAGELTERPVRRVDQAVFALDRDATDRIGHVRLDLNLAGAHGALHGVVASVVDLGVKLGQAGEPLVGWAFHPFVRCLHKCGHGA